MIRKTIVVCLGISLSLPAGAAHSATAGSEIWQQSKSNSTEIQRVDHRLLKSSEGLGRLFKQEKQKKKSVKPAPAVINLTGPGVPTSSKIPVGTKASLSLRATNTLSPKTMVQGQPTSPSVHSKQSSLFSQQVRGHRPQPLSAIQRTQTSSALSINQPPVFQAKQKSSFSNPVFNRNEALNQLLANSGQKPQRVSGQNQVTNHAQSSSRQGIRNIYTAPFSRNPLRSSASNRPSSENGRATGNQSVTNTATNRSQNSSGQVRQVGFQQELTLPPTGSSSFPAGGHRPKPLKQAVMSVGSSEGHSSIKVSGKQLVTNQSRKKRNDQPTLKLSNPHRPKPLSQVMESPNLDADMLELEEFSTKRKDTFSASPELTDDDLKKLEANYKLKNQQKGLKPLDSFSLDQKSPINQKPIVSPKTARVETAKNQSISVAVHQSEKSNSNQVIQVSGEYGPSFLDLIFDVDQLGGSKKQLQKRLGTPVRISRSGEETVFAYRQKDGLVPRAYFRGEELSRIDFQIQDPDVWSTVKAKYGLGEFNNKIDLKKQIVLPEVNLMAVALDRAGQAKSMDNVVVDRIVFQPGLREKYALEAVTSEFSGAESTVEKPQPAKPALAQPKRLKEATPKTNRARLVAYDMSEIRSRIAKLAQKYGQSGQTVLEEVHYYNLRQEFHLASATIDRLDPQFLDTNDLICFYYETACCHLGRKNVSEADLAIANLEQLEIEEQYRPIQSAVLDHLKGRRLLLSQKPEQIRSKELQKAVGHFTKSIQTLQRTSGIDQLTVRRLAATLYVFNHSYQGQAIAEGPYNNKEKASKLWYQQADSLSQKMASKRTASPILQMAAQRIAVDAAAHTGDPKKIQFALNSLHSQFANVRFKMEAIDRDLITLWLAEDYYVAAFHNYRTNDLTQATRLHRQSERFLKLIKRVHSDDQKTWLGYCVSRNHWLKGAIEQKLGRTNIASEWFDKSIKAIPTQLTARISADQVNQGERLANMAVTFWNQKRHQKAIQLTGRGLELIQECVSLGQCSAARMNIPENNLIQMQTGFAQLQQKTQAEKALIASKKNGTVAKNRASTSTKAKTLPVSSKKKVKSSGPVPIIKASDVPESAWRPKN